MNNTDSVDTRVDDPFESLAEELKQTLKRLLKKEFDEEEVIAITNQLIGPVTRQEIRTGSPACEVVCRFMIVALQTNYGSDQRLAQLAQGLCPCFQMVSVDAIQPRDVLKALSPISIN